MHIYRPIILHMSKKITLMEAYIMTRYVQISVIGKFQLYTLYLCKYVLVHA